MAKVKAPDIKHPAKKEYRTTEDYISGFTRHCSNELDGFDEPTYHQWLTPEHARSVARIAKENIIEKAVAWIKRENENENGGCHFDGWEEQFRQEMMEAEV